MVQWLELSASTAGPGSIPGQGTKIPQAIQHGKKKKKKKKKKKNHMAMPFMQIKNLYTKQPVVG